MSKQITRRDILKFAGGSALGILFTPIPWKLLDDTAIWTQNWGLTPQLPRGPISTKFSTCTLCNGGCAVKAKCVSGMPYYLSGVQNHPISHGVLCPRGISGHHLAYHPLRITHPHKFVGKSDHSTLTAVSYDEVISEIANKIKSAKGSVAILDQQPGRAISEMYSNILNTLTNGILLTAPSREDATLLAIQEMMNVKSERLGFDFENTKLIISFGAPLLDNWGNPGRMTNIFKNRKESGLKLIQIESRYSRTAMQADQWIAINPGTEQIFALTLANVILTENFYSKQAVHNIVDLGFFKKSIRQYTPEATSNVTGIDAYSVRSLAKIIAQSESAIVLSGPDAGSGPFDSETEKSIASLNIILGNIRKPGGIVTRREIPSYKTSVTTNWSKVPDHSVSVLIVDPSDSGYALPWKLIEKKLIPNDNVIITLSPYLTELSAHADYIIPAPAHFEYLQDVTTSSGSINSYFALASPLLNKPEGTTEPIELIKSICNKIGLGLEIPLQEELLKTKVAAIHESKKGNVVAFADGSIKSVTEFSSTDDLWTALIDGAVWIDEQPKLNSSRQSTFDLKSIQVEPTYKVDSTLLIPHGWRGGVSAALISPLMSKIFQEMELRDNNGVVSINPTTAANLNLSNNDSVVLETSKGSMNVRVKTNPAVHPGVIEASIGPLPNGVETPIQPNGNNVLNLCEVSSDGTWRRTKATLVKA